MRRCFDLARNGAGRVSPNPLVGAVVVHDGKIIGEGFHREYGLAHAERNAINSVPERKRDLLARSTLYVSLEPCCHFGKTPPCTDLIITSGIREVVISMQDPNPVVSGKGISALRAHGVTVHENVLADEGANLIRYFRTYMRESRPHIILKAVQSRDGFIGRQDEQVWLSNAYERVMVHKLRSEVDAIMVGTNTAIVDDPELTTRFYPGNDPVRIAVDRTGRIPLTHHLFDGTAKTILFTAREDVPVQKGVDWIRCAFDENIISTILSELYARRIQSLLVEGGAALLNSFLEQGVWDEAIVVRTPKELRNGVKAPLIEGRLKWRYEMAGDEVFSIVP